MMGHGPWGRSCSWRYSVQVQAREILRIFGDLTAQRLGVARAQGCGKILGNHRNIWENLGKTHKNHGKILGKSDHMGKKIRVYGKTTRNGAFEWWMFQLAMFDYRFFFQPQSHWKLDTWKSWRKYHRKSPSWFHTFQQLFGDPYIPNGIRWWYHRGMLWNINGLSTSAI